MYVGLFNFPYTKVEVIGSKTLKSEQQVGPGGKKKSLPL